jgi:predicted Fe-Mo cluster-binding NifX family protein
MGPVDAGLRSCEDPGKPHGGGPADVESERMVICVPVMPDGRVDQRWGRAARVAVARIEAGTIVAWDEFDVGWDRLHDDGTEGGHHARIARFVVEHGISTVLAGHMGPPMVQMLGRMGVDVRLGAAGDARLAVVGAG